MTRTGLVTTIAIIILGIYDLVMVLFTGTGGSISQFLVNAGFTAPVLVFAFGFVAGHLFGYMSPTNIKGKTNEISTTRYRANPVELRQVLGLQLRNFLRSTGDKILRPLRRSKMPSGREPSERET